MIPNDEARRNLTAAQMAYAPTELERARNRAALSQLVAAGGPTRLESSGTRNSGTGAVQRLSAAGKIALIGAVFLGAAAGIVALRKPHQHKAQSLALRIDSAEPVQVVTAPQLPDVVSSTPAGDSTAETPTAARPKAVSSANVAVPDVEGEIRLLSEAQRALSGGDARRALSILEDHARTYPRGELTQERKVAKIVALCRLGATSDAERERSVYVHQYPASPLNDRIDATCGTAPAAGFPSR